MFLQVSGYYGNAVSVLMMLTVIPASITVPVHTKVCGSLL